MAQNIHIARRQVAVNNVLGLHLRVAGRFVRLAQAFQSDVKVHCKDIIADGRSILSLFSLAAECGTMLALEAQGCDAEDAVAALANPISAQFHESEDQGGEPARATASKIPVILAVLDGNLVYSYNVYYWHSFNNHPNYGCKSLEYSQNFRSITVSGLPYLMKNPHFDAVALGTSIAPGHDSVPLPLASVIDIH